jgi:hypothetical protein
MAMDTREREYVSFTSEAPYGVALVRRKFDGRVAGARCFKMIGRYDRP